MTPEIRDMIAQQKRNTIRAYNSSEIDYSESVLDGIVEDGLNAKYNLYQHIEDGVLLVTRPYVEEELLRESYSLRELKEEHLDHSFDFSHKQVTERATGKCMPLKKFLKNLGREDYQIDQYLTDTSREKQLLIAANPWFLIGSSVAARGENVESSCHHPSSSTNDYKSGAISYALDSQTIIFGAWDEQGLSGRQLVYVDLEAPGIVAGRKYGYISEMDSKFLRQILYPLISPSYKYGDWKKTGNHRIEKNGYSGYLDDSYFEGYRPQKDNPIRITLTRAVCPSCGGKNYDGTLLCSDCSRERFHCDGCNGHFDEDEHRSADGYDYCSDCYFERYFCCDRCGNDYDLDERCECNGYDYCQNCAERKGYSQCSSCGEWSMDCASTADGAIICQECVEADGLEPCSYCGEYDDPHNMVQTIEGDYYCQSDADRYLTQCDHCGGFTNTTTNTTTTDLEVCDQCADDIFIHSCPTCKCISEIPGACCEECATALMFKTSDNYMFSNQQAA